MHNSSKQVVFVTPDIPTEQSVDGLAIARLIGSLPLDWKVKALVVRSKMPSIPNIPKLSGVEIILIPEPQLNWDAFVLRVATLPLEKLARVESREIAQKILSYVHTSDYTFVFPNSPVLKLISRELEAIYSGNKHGENLGLSLESGGELSIQVLQNQPSNSSQTKWRSLFENAKGNNFYHRTFMTDVSRAFDFDPLLNRKYESSGQALIETKEATSKNRIVNWSSPSQPILESGIVIISPIIAFFLRPRRIIRKAVEFAAASLAKALYKMLKIGYAVSKLLFKVLSAVRKKVFDNLIFVSKKARLRSKF